MRYGAAENAILCARRMKGRWTSRSPRHRYCLISVLFFCRKRHCAARRNLVSYASTMVKLEFESVGRKALVRRGRSRVGAFAHGSSTPPPPLIENAAGGLLTALRADAVRLCCATGLCLAATGFCLARSHGGTEFLHDSLIGDSSTEVHRLFSVPPYLRVRYPVYCLWRFGFCSLTK